MESTYRLQPKLRLTKFGSIFSFLMMSAILDFGHYQKSQKNGNYNSWYQHRNLQPKPNHIKFGSIFNFNMVSAVLDFDHYEKSQR